MATDQPRAGKRMLVRLRVVSLHVQRLRAVRERVHRRPDGLRTRQGQCQLGLVHDAGELRARAAAPHAAVGVADTEVRRPLRSRIGGGDRHDRDALLGGDRLPEVDGATPAERDDAVACSRRRIGDTVGRYLPPARRSLDRKLLRLPPVARDEQRPLDPELREHGAELPEPPADDHFGSRERANSTNACAARVSTRPLERTRRISRTGSSPRTPAVAIVPAAMSDSIAVREMNATPCPAATALRTDSWSPSSTRTSRSRRRVPTFRNSSSITCLTPAPSCITSKGSARSSSSVTVLPAKRWPLGHASTTSSRKNGS